MIAAAALGSQQPVVIRAADGIARQLSAGAGQLSALIAAMAADYEDEGDAVLLPGVEGHGMDKIGEYLEAVAGFKADAKAHSAHRQWLDSLTNGSLAHSAHRQWLNSFVGELGCPLLIQILTAANYLGIECLQKVLLGKLAMGIAARSPGQVSELLGVRRFSADRANQLIEAHDWIDLEGHLHGDDNCDGDEDQSLEQLIGHLMVSPPPHNNHTHTHTDLSALVPFCRW